MKKHLKIVSFILAVICAVIWVPRVNADYVPDNALEIIEDAEKESGKDKHGSVDTSADFEDASTFTYATVNVYQLNMRSGPSSSYNIIHVLNQNEQLKVYGKIDGWYIVQDMQKGHVGCVSGYYITLSNASNNNQNNGSSSSADEEKLLNMINELRAQNGLKPLTINQELSRVALHKAMDMVENNYFSHQSPTYGSPFEMMKKYGIVFTAAAENIAGNQTVEGAVYSWKNSEGHLANILNSAYSETGIGIYTSPIYGKIFVQMFKN